MSTICKIIIMILSFAFIWVCYAEAEDEKRYIIMSQTIRVVTAYNAGDPNQCDSDPCIDASNSNICEALKKGERRCAANFVKLGTVLDIDKWGICVVTDRTNKRYRNRVDIAMQKHERDKALKFGRQKLHVKIIKIKE